jgi:hypothetical protein
MAGWQDGAGVGARCVLTFVARSRTYFFKCAGSIFNHSSTPNVSYILDSEHACITYTTMRPVAPTEELCIFYGTKLWFEDHSATSTELDGGEERENAWARLVNVEWKESGDDLDELIPETELPFERVAVAGEDDEEDEGEGQVQTSACFSVLHHTTFDILC